MRFFGKKKNKTKDGNVEEAKPETSPKGVKVAKVDYGAAPPGKKSAAINPTLDMVPKLIQDLATAKETSGDKPASALRMLFALSEHSTDGETRTKMVRVDGAKLVPVLLQFLQRCARGSSEQYLALLVLNNVSIPIENKRLIALDCSAAHIFCRLLCKDPSCHLMAIILVNLTFADAELRKELVAPTSKIEIVESLAYALRVSTLTPEEHAAREPLPENQDSSAKVLLSTLLEEDHLLRSALSDLDHNRSNNYRDKKLLLDPARLLYPETARWCLSAIKNLTRPAKESAASSCLIETGILPLVMKLVTVGRNADGESQKVNKESSENHSFQSSSSDTPPTAAPPGDVTVDVFNNSPTNWDSNSMQDAALFVIMNLAASETSTEAVRELDGVQILTKITEHRQNNPIQLTFDEGKQLDFQCLKARMAVAYLVGSEGHFGQNRVKNGSAVHAIPNDSAILLSENEAYLMVELLANTLSQRAKEGLGGYSAATFNVKWVLFAINCLLTHSLNQIRFINIGGARLNALLIKALALHSIKNTPSIDTDAAQYAAFSLYLQSNYGFSTTFLPAIFGNHYNIAGKGSLAAKILTSYIHMESITPAGRHAADQLLLRLRYLNMSGSLNELASPGGIHAAAPVEYGFDAELLEAAEAIIVEKRIHGARPRDDIFDRPILRSRAPKKGDDGAPWDNRASVSVYPSALLAVQHLSFGSTKVRHMDAIDDILIANNIANSANGEKTESYNYWWSWQDAADEIQKNLERQRSLESMSMFSAGNRKDGQEASGPMSIFGFNCLSLCADDTTTTYK